MAWYPSGHIQASARFVDGKLEGRWETWHENGVKKEEGQYSAGSPEGLWMAWTEKGAPLADTANPN